MHLIAALALIATDLSETHLQRNTAMEISRKADMKTVDGPPEYFTGKAAITGQSNGPILRVGGAIVHFEPGARTAWHTHPAGQALIVTEGIGWTQITDGPKLKFRAGDILWCPAEHKHWHGATPHEGMKRILEHLASGPLNSLGQAN